MQRDARDPTVGYGVLTPALKVQVETLATEGCSVDPRNPELPAGLQAGDQVRIHRHDGAGLALFTVTFRDEREGHRRRLRITRAGRKRLGYDTPAGERLQLCSVVVADLTEAGARAREELIEVVQVAPATRLLVLAPHGGAMERRTDSIAARVARAPALAGSTSLWTCQGYAPPGRAQRRWHITSAALAERSYPGLARVGGARRYEHALALHGHNGAAILVGGGGPRERRERVAAALEALDLGVPVQLVGAGNPLGGVFPRNVVNRYSDGGVQLELPRAVRLDHWEAVADALVEVYRPR
jgi:phage replication-related protein YjqB (UPF0714/DUF867 family)